MSSKRKQPKTVKETEDGRLVHIRDDGRVKLLSRRKALIWARRNAPGSFVRIATAYDEAETNAANAKVLEAEHRIATKE